MVGMVPKAFRFVRTGWPARGCGRRRSGGPPASLFLQLECEASQTARGCGWGARDAGQVVVDPGGGTQDNGQLVDVAIVGLAVDHLLRFLQLECEATQTARGRGWGAGDAGQVAVGPLSVSQDRQLLDVASVGLVDHVFRFLCLECEASQTAMGRRWGASDDSQVAVGPVSGARGKWTARGCGHRWSGRLPASFFVPRMRSQSNCRGPGVGAGDAGQVVVGPLSVSQDRQFVDVAIGGLVDHLLRFLCLECEANQTARGRGWRRDLGQVVVGPVKCPGQQLVDVAIVGLVDHLLRFLCLECEASQTARGRGWGAGDLGQVVVGPVAAPRTMDSSWMWPSVVW